MRRVLALAIALPMLTGCGNQSTGTPGPSAGSSSLGTTPSTHETLAIGEFNPFTGPDASYGPEMAAGCIPAVNLINQAGGVLGHKLECVVADTRGDPADAVPAASQLLATQSNLVGILGPSSDEADATAPIFNDSKMTMMGDTGAASFDQNAYPYFWRLTPADDVKGTAMAIWGRQKGFSHAAAVFGNDIGSQTDVPTLVKAFTKLGGTIVSNESLALDQGDYRTEVARMLATNPDVLFIEADAQTEATFLANLKDLHGLIPVIGTSLDQAMYQAVGGAIGAQNMHDFYTTIRPLIGSLGTSTKTYDQALLASGSQVPKPDQWISDPFCPAHYDEVNLLALSMIAANSTTPSTYNSYIPQVANPGSGKTLVYSFDEGQKALAAGKQIQYVGASGFIDFNKFNNSTTGFEAFQFQLDGSTVSLGTIPIDEITQANS